MLGSQKWSAYTYIYLLQVGKGVNPLGPIAPKVAQSGSSLRDNSDNSRANQDPAAYHLGFGRCLASLRVQRYTDLDYKLTLQSAINLGQSRLYGRNNNQELPHQISRK